MAFSSFHWKFGGLLREDQAHAWHRTFQDANKLKVMFVTSMWYHPSQPLLFNMLTFGERQDK